ncbi:hypothetical protein ABIE41_003859 [Bosea sp. OAE506]|uniref:hypothetical protein n=1 Tax=Bosea sp. OAE506 TaxID=2663870 RepID=UPI00178AE35B
MSNYGLIKFRLPTGQNLSVRGSVTRNPARVSRESVVNLDGTVDRTETPMGYRFALSLQPKTAEGVGIDFDALMAFDKVTFTFLHDSERVDRTYSRASLIGDPQVDDMTGEVTGITGVAEGYLETPR